MPWSQGSSRSLPRYVLSFSWRTGFIIPTFQLFTHADFRLVWLPHSLARSATQMCYAGKSHYWHEYALGTIRISIVDTEMDEHRLLIHRGCLFHFHRR